MAEPRLPATEAACPRSCPPTQQKRGRCSPNAACGPWPGHRPSCSTSPRQAEEALDATRAGAARLQALGADVMMSVPKRGDLPIGDRLDADGWKHVFALFRAVDDVLAEFGLRQALHPHVDSLVETAEDMTTVLEGCDVGWCFDTAHVASGGMDPVEFARTCPTINHFHLKDGRPRRSGARWWTTRSASATPSSSRSSCRSARATCPSPRSCGRCGRDDVWWVLEQDQAVPAPPSAGQGPIASVARSLDYLAAVG